MSFSQTSAGVKDTSKKNLIKAIITKKKFRILFFPQNTKDDEKKILKIQKHRIKKKLQKKKSTQIRSRKKINKTLQKPKS